jgi:signal peptide peptidase SppA
MAPKPEFYLLESAKREPNEYFVKNGIAMIDVFGVLVHRGGGMNADSTYLQGYDDLAKQLEMAKQDDSVKQIVLNIDSPGGEGAGLAQLAESIHELQKTKPVEAFVSDMATSAAYWLASAATTITMTSTAEVGSIGVYMRHMDVSKALEKDGVKVTYINAGRHKVDGNPYEPLSEDVRDSFQKTIDFYYEMFTNAVANYRKLSVQSIRDTEAKVFVAKDALSLGLVDRIASSPLFVQSSLEVQVEITELQNRLDNALALNAELNAKLTAEQSTHSEIVSDLQSQLLVEQNAAQAANLRATQLEEQLANYKLDSRKSAVQSLFADLHREYSDDSAAPYLEMSDAAFSAVATDLRTLKAPVLKDSLFKDVAVSGVIPGKNEADWASQLFAQVAGVK